MDNYESMVIINDDSIQPQGIQCIALCTLPAVACASVACGLAVLGMVITSALAPAVATLGGSVGAAAGDATAEGQ